MRWRTVLATFTGVESTLFGLAMFSVTYQQMSPVIRITQYTLIGLSSAGVALAVPLWLGRIWALWILRGVVLVALIAMIVLGFFNPGDGRIDAWEMMTRLAFFGSLLAVPAFFLVVLFHRDVVADFKGSSGSRA
jgi:hypothetical protein